MEHEEADLLLLLSGRTIKNYAIGESNVDLTFTDNTKVYNLTKHPQWIHFDAKGYPDSQPVLPVVPSKTTKFQEMVKERCIHRSKKENKVDGVYDYCKIEKDFCDMAECPLIDRHFKGKKEPN